VTRSLRDTLRDSLGDSLHSVCSVDRESVERYRAAVQPAQRSFEGWMRSANPTDWDWYEQGRDSSYFMAVRGIRTDGPGCLARAGASSQSRFLRRCFVVAPAHMQGDLSSARHADGRVGEWAQVHARVCAARYTQVRQVRALPPPPAPLP
jgi:hypothetical protein